MKFRLLTIVLLLWLYGCSGGISGTGDGGPVKPTDVGGIAVDVDSNLPDNSSTESADSLARFSSFPNQLILDLPGSLRADSTESPSAANSPGTRLRDGITAAQLDLSAIQIDLFILDQYLNKMAANGDGNISAINCAQNCQLLDQLINVVVDADAEAFAISQTDNAVQFSTNSFSDSTGLRTGDSITYTGVSLQSGLAGFFDNRLQYNRSNGSQIVLQWSSDQLWVSILAQNTDSTLYSFLQIDSSEMTLRRTDHLRGDASIQLLAIQDNAAIATGDTYIEADLTEANPGQVNANTDEPFFLRATGDTNTAAIFSEGLLLNSMQYREAINSAGQLTDLETCVQPCDQWQSRLDSQSLPDTFFDTYKNMVESVARTIVNSVDVSIVPDSIDEFVITIGGPGANAGNPIIQPQSIVCGGQRQKDYIRTFCWHPTPFDSPTFLFEENRDNGTTSYRPITQ